MTTYIATRSVQHINRLTDNVSSYSTLSMDRIRQYTGLFLSKGDELAKATDKAYSMMQGAVMRQALVITHADAFLVIGAFFGSVCLFCYS